MKGGMRLKIDGKIYLCHIVMIDYDAFEIIVNRSKVIKVTDWETLSLKKDKE